MQSYAQLHTLITAAFRDASPKQRKALELKLVRLRPQFRNLLFEEPTDASIKKDLEQGQLSIGGRKDFFNKDFATEVLQLSDLLGISELRAFTLMKHSVDKAPTYDRKPIEVAVLEYGRERSAMVECLELMLKGCNDNNVGEESRKLFKHHLEEFFKTDATSGTGSLAGRSESYPQRILRLLVEYKNKIVALREDGTLVNGIMTGAQLKTKGLTEQLIHHHADNLSKLRLALAGFLYYYTMYEKMEWEDIVVLVETQQAADLTDHTWRPVLLSLLERLDPSEATKVAWIGPDSMKLISALTKINKLLDMSPRWTVPSLREVISIQYCGFLKRGRMQRQNLEQDIGLPESIEVRLESSFQNEPFRFVMENIIPFKCLDPKIYVEQVTADSELQAFMVITVKRLVIEFLKLMGRVVRNLKSAAEDIPVLPMQQYGRPMICSQSSPFEQLLNLISSLHKDSLDGGYIYWDDADLLKFLKFVADARSVQLLQAYLDMLASLASGPRCARKAAEFLHDQTRLTWDILFNSIAHAAKMLAAHPDQEMNPAEVSTQKSFLRLLTQVIKFSEIDRVSLYSHARMDAISKLFSLLNRRVPVELKAALFEAIAAFCLPLEATGTSEIAPIVWRHLEYAEVVPKPRDGASVQYGSQSSGTRPTLRVDGIRFDMDQIESQNQTYPETLAFLLLLHTLLYSTKPNELYGITESVAIGGRAFSGTKHYIDFVVEDVFLKIRTRVFSTSAERWRMIDSCLRIFDLCLRSFDSIFITGRIEDYQLDDDAMNGVSKGPGEVDLQEMGNHPAFMLVARILAGSPLVRGIFDVLDNTVDDINTHGPTCPPFPSAIKNTLRILLRILQMQKLYLDLVALDAGKRFRIPYSMTGLDTLLGFYKDSVIKILLLIDCAIDDEICLLSINIVTILSQSSVFLAVESEGGSANRVNRLVSLLANSEYSQVILTGYVNRLVVDEPENVMDIELHGHTGTSGLNLDQLDDPHRAVLIWDPSVVTSYISDKPGISNLIQLAILDLLVMNLDPSRPFPSVAHYLLGYDTKKSSANVQLLSTGINAGKKFCLQVILDMLRAGTNKRVTDDIGGDIEVEVPLYESHPKLSEKCFQLIYHLCSEISTSAVTMRYLRTNEDFFYRQLESMPSQLPSTRPSLGNGPQSGMSVDLGLEPKIAATQIHQRAWLLKLIALELHMTALAGQRSHVQKLLDLLFVNNTATRGQADSDYQQRSGFDQPLTKMLDILNSLDFDRGGETGMSSTLTTYLNESDISKCLQIDDYGRRVYDIRAVQALLQSKQKALEKQGGISVTHELARQRNDAAEILNDLLSRNLLIQDHGSRIHCVDGWCKIMRTAFGRCFEIMSPETREDKAFKVLEAIFPKVNAPNASNAIVEQVSYVILALISRLRYDRAYQTILQSASTVTDGSLQQYAKFPVDSLQNIVLKGILDGLLKPDATVLTRGNLYTSMLFYLQYTNPDEVEQIERTNDLIFNPSQAISSSSLFNGSYRASLLLGNLTTIESYGDRLYEILCRDASDGADVWKGVAFSLLEALYALSSHEKPNKILTFMVKRNFLNDFIKVIQARDDLNMQALLDSSESDASSNLLPSIWVFQSKLCMLVRLAQQKDGVNKLVENGIIETLADCKFIDLKPEPIDRMDSDSVTSPFEIYHEVVHTVLQIVLSVNTLSGRDQAKVVSKLSQFVMSHQDYFIDVLRAKKPHTSSQLRTEMELVTGILSGLAANRNLIDAHLHGPGHRSFHNMLLAVLYNYSNLFERDSLANSASQETRDQERHVRNVCKNILSYCEFVTNTEMARDIGSARFSMVFNVFGGAESKGDADNLKRLSAQAIIRLLQNFVSQLLQTMDELKASRHKLQDVQRLAVDEVNEIAIRSQQPFVDEISTVQRQQLASRQLKVEIRRKTDDVLNLLYTIEHCLLLWWRYCEFVNELRLAKSANLLSDMEVRRLKQESLQVVNKVASVEVTSDITVAHNSRNAFLNMLCRKIRMQELV
ncbi:hypothetical protein HDU76_012695 [Blyttiomyces sp. JEL0837]|nr:hypothetical protein HDU76_012695 [Blyttiomyces sp. JEL0837]